MPARRPVTVRRSASALPHNWDTERALLGGLLLDAGALAEVRSLVSPAVFHRPSHAALFELLLDLDARGVALDVVTVAGEVEARGWAERVGGIAYVIGLPNTCASVGNVPAYAERLADLAARRGYVLALREAEERAADPTIPTSELIAQAEGRLAEVSAGAVDGTRARLAARLERCHVYAIAERFTADLDPARRRAAVARFPWPGTPGAMPARSASIPAGHLLPVRDRASRAGPSWARTADAVGPWTAGTLGVLVGATGRGKSSFALQVGHGVAMTGAPVLYVSVEMGTDELLARLLALRSSGAGGDGHGVAWSSVLLGGAPFEDTCAAAAELCGDCPALYLWAPGPEERTVHALQEMARAVSRAHGGAPPFVVLDYVQRLTPPGADDRRLAVGDVSAGLRDLSRAGLPMGPDWPGAAVLALSSTGRTSYSVFETTRALRDAAKGTPEKPPAELVGLGKESGELEYDAPLVLAFTTDPAPDDPASRAAPRRGLLAVAKNRLFGGRPLIAYTFAPACGRFREMTAAEVERFEEETAPAAPARGTGKGTTSTGRADYRGDL